MKRTAAAPPTDARLDLDKSFSFRLILLVNLLSRPFYSTYGKRHDISINEWRIIMTLSAHPGISASEICSMSGLHKMNVSRGVLRLTRQGRLSNSPDPADGRRKILNLTAKGRAVFNSVFPSAVEQERAMLAGLSSAEKRTVSRILDKLARQGLASAAA